MFVLAKDNQVFYGPNNWNVNLIKSYIEDEFELDINVPSTPITSGTELSDGIFVYEINNILIPEYNSKIEKLEGPFYSFINGKANISYLVVEKPLEQIKSELLAIIANNRWKKEVGGVIVSIQGQQIKFPTDRNERNIFLQALQTQYFNNVWKLYTETGEIIWLTLNENDLTSIVTAISTHITNAFAWENTIATQINTASSAIDLDGINLECPA